jgi:perosamine synthetase
MKNIWFNKPDIGWREKWEVFKVLNSGWISTGKKVKEFEKEFLKYLGLDGIKYAVATNSCTAAMHLALLLEGIGEMAGGSREDEVIVPSVTFPATANVVEHVGAKVVFVDVEPYTLNMNMIEVNKKITDKTRAIMPVNLYGNACDLRTLHFLVNNVVRVEESDERVEERKEKIVVIQDNAHAIESRYMGVSLPYYADYSCYSFYATKNMTTAEGGMLIVGSEEKRAKAEMLSLHGLSKDAWKRYNATGYNLWDLEYAGWKYNMTDIAAAMGLCQLKKVDENWKRRAKIVYKYKNAFKGLDKIRLIEVEGFEKQYCFPAYHLFPIIFGDDVDKTQEQIIRELEGYGVGVGVHFPCLPLTKYYREKYGYNKGDFPIASKMTEKIVSIPLYPSLKDWEVDRIIDAVKGVVKK